MGQTDVGVEITALPTEIHFFRGREQPFIDHADFSVRNHSERSIAVAVTGVALEDGERRQELESWFVYDTSNERSVAPDGFVLSADRQRLCSVSFARVPYRPGLGDAPRISLTFIVDGKTFVRSSEVSIVEEYPA